VEILGKREKKDLLHNSPDWEVGKLHRKENSRDRSRTKRGVTTGDSGK